MDRSNLIFLDTETTGSGDHDRLCQLAWKQHNDVADRSFSKMFKPPLNISIEAMSVHHITPAMVADKPLFIQSPDYQQIKILLEGPETVLVAHNAPFDVSMMQKESIDPANAIDTLKLVRHFDPNMVMERHNLQYLRYFLKLDDLIDIEIRPHDALSDVIVLELLFDRLYLKAQKQFNLVTEAETIQKMIELSTQPAMVGKFAFGKYKGTLVKDVAEVDRGYLEWMLNQKRQSDQDESDWIYTLKTVLSGL